MTELQANQQLQLKISDEVLKGVYANMAQIGHTPEEFILDFMNVFPPAGSVSARVIISPGHAKRLLAALQDNIKKYEEQFGSIKASDDGIKPATTISSSGNNYGFRTE